MKRAITLLITIAVAASALAVDKQKALAASRTFLGQLGESLPAEELGQVHAELTSEGTFWLINYPHHQFTVDNSGAEVVSYINGHLEGALMGGPSSKDAPKWGKAFYQNQEDVLDRVDDILARTGWDRGTVLREPLPMPDERGEIAHAKVSADFNHRPNGYRAPGMNFTMVVLDSLSGEVVSMDRNLGFTFESPTARLVSPEAARASAAPAVGEVQKISDVHYQQLFSNFDAISERAQDMLVEKTVPLVYTVNSEDVVALVSATTGEVLCTYPNMRAALATTSPTKIPVQPKSEIVRPMATATTAAAPAEASQQPSEPKKPKPTSGALLFGLAAAAIAAVAGLFLYQRRSHGL